MSDYILSLERIAMSRVVSDSFEDSMRRIRRWYCRHFYTPLSIVEEMTDEELLVEYFEYLFEEMGEDDRQNKLKELCLTQEDKAAKKVAEDDFDKKLLEEMRKDLEKFESKKTDKLPKPKTKEEPIKKVENKPDISISFSEPEDMTGWD